MKAMIFEQFGSRPSIEMVDDPICQDDGVIVRTLATGICRSDWHGWMGHDPDIRLPHVPGHELVGEVVEKGRFVDNFHIGDRVTVPFVSGCGDCPMCMSDNHQICDHQFQPGFSAWGSFAEYTALRFSDQNLVKLPEELDSAAAASLGCRFVTSFRAIVDQAELKSGETIVIFGCGGVGLSAIQIAQAAGARVIAVDVNRSALEMAQKCGAHETLMWHEDIAQELKQLTRGGASICMDAIGNKQVCYKAITSLKKQGRYLQVGLMTGVAADPQIPMHMVIANELRIIGSHGMQAFRYPAMFDFVRSSGIDLNVLIRDRISLTQAVDVLVKMDQNKQAGVSVITEFT